jgi:hypothetical protein
MQVPFSQLPGRYERHLRRRLDHPFFPRQIGQLTDEILLNAQRLDHEELVSFIEQLRTLVQEAINLPPNTGSETLLNLKDRLDQSYTVCAALADDQTANRAAIKDLTKIIMRPIQQQAGADNLAEMELAAESAARQAHYQMLEQPLVADLLHPQSCIEADELPATLAAEADEGLEVALGLFDEDQLFLILQELEQLSGLWPQEAKIQRSIEQIRARIGS